MSIHFSIIIPVYNAENTLTETLDSIASQTYKAFEIICVNDGSNDQSKAIAQDWHRAHPDIDFTLIDQANGGLGNARNRGIKAAKYPWLALLDADDIWVPEKLARLCSVIDQTKADLVFHSFKTFGGKHSRVRRGHTVKSLEDILIKGNPLMPSATVLRTSMLLEFPFSEDKNIHGAEDLELWIRLLNSNKSFHFLNSPLTLYRETDGMSTRIDEHLAHVLFVISKYHEQGWISDDLHQKAISRKNWEAGRFHHKRGNFKQALIHYGLSLDPTPAQRLIIFLARIGLSL